MKNLFKTTLFIAALTSIIACKNDAEKNNETAPAASKMTSSSDLTFEDKNVAVQFQHYIHIKTALVNSNASEAQAGAKMLLDEATDENIKKILSDLSSNEDLEKQRELFSDLTKAMTPLVKETISGGEVYQQFCPMAFDNTGGYWLSKNEEVRNPYYGDRMLKCGRVTETIK